MTVQPFTFPFFQELAPTTFSQTGPAGVFDSELKPNGRFYDVIRNSILG